MSSEEIEVIRVFLKEHVHNLDTFSGGGGGGIVSLPTYDIHPREFLMYAELELSDLGTTCSIVNCVSNLKRAIDCQIDVFLHAINLLTLYKDKGLGIDRKLGFIEKCGIFNSRSLSRINTIRNKLEHHYEIPKIEDIFVYFDLVSAFISVLEVTLNIGGTSAEVEFGVIEYPENEELEPNNVGYLRSVYIPSDRKHEISWERNALEEKHIATYEDLNKLAAFLRFHLLLRNVADTCHGDYANMQLEKL